tara:strand:+ start:388 stop:1272 length:885 start_codon:yes stop_codon:yes gene_type:complete
MKKISSLISLSIIFFYSTLLVADEKSGVINNITSGFSSALEAMIGGEGDTEVEIIVGEDYKPEFSIMTVRPLSQHEGVNAWFVQLQLNDTKIRSKSRLSTNVGVGYRTLGDDKTSMTGGNLFIDYDEDGNARASLGIELRSASFETLVNYYQGLSGAKTVGNYTERVLDGSEISLIGQIPYLPWASIIANHYEWSAEKNSKDSKGEKISLELTLTPTLLVDVGYDDNNISGTSNFAKIMFVYPPRDRVAASTNFIGDTAFSQADMSLELLSKVRRTNKIIIESEGSGLVMARGN